MPRKVRDSNLETRTARSRLKVAHRPYYRMIESGLHVGYRKLASGPGRWVVRRYGGDGKYVVENLRGTDGEVIIADDYSEPDGIRVLSFGQAQDRARAFLSTKAGPFTVGEACDDYLEAIAREGKATVEDARLAIDALIRPKLGNVEVAKLTAKAIRDWLTDLANTPARVRTRAGAPQQFRDSTDDADAHRRRRSSANRTLAVLKSALNRAWREGKTPSNAEWQRVESFKKVAVARVHYLSTSEAQRLINAAAPDFRQLITAALTTGCRYSELCRLEVRDFDSDSGTIAVRKSKSGKPRHVVLTTEGVEFFRGLCAGRLGSEIVLLKADGSPWLKAHQQVPMQEACARAKLAPRIGFHQLRHTWASLSAMAGVPLMVIGRNLGHADTRMVESYYGHLAPSYISDAIRAGAPRFGLVPDRVVKPLSQRR